MGDLAPIAFDIETSGLEPGAVITVAGLAFELGEVILLNTADRCVDVDELEGRLDRYSAGRVKLEACQDERELLTALEEASTEQINTDALT